MNGKLKKVVTTLEKPFKLIYCIKDSHSKRKVSYICIQGVIKRDIKEGDKDVLMQSGQITQRG